MKRCWHKTVVIPGTCSSTLHLAAFDSLPNGLQNETSGLLERTENWQLDITVAGTSCVWEYGSELTYYFPPGSWRKLTTLKMQSESGIVPDFEVGEEFHEEPKTYYELKSQPLKNRSVNGAFDSSEMPFLYCMFLKVWYAWQRIYFNVLLVVLLVSNKNQLRSLHARDKLERLAVLTAALIIMDALELRRVSCSAYGCYSRQRLRIQHHHQIFTHVACLYADLTRETLLKVCWTLPTLSNHFHKHYVKQICRSSFSLQLQIQQIQRISCRTFDSGEYFRLKLYFV